MKRLVELGFIDAQTGPNGPFSYILIWNPHLVIKRLRDEGKYQIANELYNALIARLIEIGATDLG
jgi:hypothetical protein